MVSIMYAFTPDIIFDGLTRNIIWMIYNMQASTVAVAMCLVLLLAVVVKYKKELYMQPVSIEFKHKGPYYSTGEDATGYDGTHAPIPPGAERSVKTPVVLPVDEIRAVVSTHLMPKMHSGKWFLVDVDQATTLVDAYDDLWLETAFNVYESRRNIGLKMYGKAVRIDKTWYVLAVRPWNVAPSKDELARGIDARNIEEFAPYVPPISI